MSKKKTEWTVSDSERAATNPRQFPPPFSTRRATLKKLIELYAVHENPDPPDCESCGMKYRDFRTGLDYNAVFDMLWVADNDPEFWRHKGRHSVLGLWYEIKRGMWDDHVGMCKDTGAQADYLDDWTQADFEY